MQTRPSGKTSRCLIRLGTDDVELRDGFPKAADELYKYHAVIIDDLEASFFTPDQQALLRNFVSQRGGGLLMLGGPDSFVEGKYDKTPVGELLPVYLNRPSVPQDDGDYRLVLTREGWLQPWVRVRKTEDEENKRLACDAYLPNAQPVWRDQAGRGGALGGSRPEGCSRTCSCGPVVRQGARGGTLDRRSVALANAPQGTGGGRLRSLVAANSTLARRRRAKSRGSDGAPKPDSATPALSLCAFGFAMLNIVRSTTPKSAFRRSVCPGVTLTLDAEPDPREAGAYGATYVPREPGAYRVRRHRDWHRTGAQWASERPAGRRSPWPTSLPGSSPTASSWNRSRPRPGARSSTATVFPLLLRASLHAARQITEPWTSRSGINLCIFLVAIGCLLGEWGLRRVNGLA